MERHLFDALSGEFTITMEALDERTCWERMSGASLGRIVFTRDGLPIALPVNCGVVSNTIVFRTGDGSMLHRLGDGEAVAFEVDHADQVAESGWSVLVRGRAFEITDEYEQDRLADLGIHAWAPGDKNRWIRIVPSTITGRAIQRHLVTDEPVPYMPPD